MANIFQGRARRPDYQAQGRIGQTLFRFGAEWMASDIAAEDARQVGNAEIAMLAEWDELQKAFDASADKPESWDGLFEKEKGRIRTQVIAGATQPGARQKIGSLVDTKFANWKSTIGTAARGQARRNQARDFAKGMKILNQVPDYGGDVGALQGRVKTTDDYIERQPYLTPNEKLDAKRDYRQIQITGYLLQTGDEDAIDNPNNFVNVNDLFLPGFEGERQELFGPPETTELKKQWKSAVNTANAENKVAMEAARDKALDEYTEAIAGGDFSNELVQKIAADPRLDAYSTERRVMINWQKQMARAVNEGKPNPLTERQNDELYWTDYKLAEDGEISETELRSHVGKDGYSIDDYQEIKRVLGTDVSGKSRAKEISTAISDLDDVIDAGTDVKYDAQERQAAKMRGRRQLEGAIAEADKAEKPLKGIDLDREALRIGRKLLEQIDKGATPEQIYSEFALGSDLDKISLAEIRKYRLRREGKVPHIKTQAELDALKSGDEFYTPNGQLRRKR